MKEKKDVILSVRLPKTLHQKLLKRAGEQMIPIGAVIRQAVKKICS